MTRTLKTLEPTVQATLKFLDEMDPRRERYVMLQSIMKRFGDDELSRQNFLRSLSILALEGYVVFTLEKISISPKVERIKF